MTEIVGGTEKSNSRHRSSSRTFLGSCRQVLEFFNGPWPVSPQQSRQRSVRKKLSSGLAVWTVVGFVRRIPNPLNLPVTANARFLVATVNGHAWPECGYLFRERVS